jgi:PAT family beta-lactamase induction signal transducer AmpG
MVQRRLPPVWLMGLCNLPFGLFGAGLFVAIPQLLTAKGISAAVTTDITAIAIIPGFCAFLISPLLDVFVSRRFYAVLFCLIQALCLFVSLFLTERLAALTVFLFLGFFASVLFNSALGGWLGSITPPEEESRLGAWFAIANFAGFGITSMIAIQLLRGLPYTLGATVLCLMVLAPLAIYPFLPAPPPDRRLAKESFARFTGDVIALFRQPGSLRMLPLFIAPCATFALVNIVGALGKEYLASETTVGLAGGLCTIVAAVIGSLLAPVLARRMPLLPLYLLIGICGSCFTLLLIALPRLPFIYVGAVLGENIFASAANATAAAIIFGTIGKHNPLAATQFSILMAATFLPQTYMQAVDGVAYGMHGLTGMLAADAGLSIVSCTIFALLWSWARRGGLGQAMAVAE